MWYHGFSFRDYVRVRLSTILFPHLGHSGVTAKKIYQVDQNKNRADYHISRMQLSGVCLGIRGLVMSGFAHRPKV